MQRSRNALLLALLVCAAPGAAAAQAHAVDLSTRSTVVREPYRTAEVVGLRRWTAEMVQDSIDRYAPGMSLFSHACAATLRSQLGFAEAASFRISNPGGRRGFQNVVLLIEPQDSALVRHRNLPRDVQGTAAPWAPLVEWSQHERTAVWYAVRSRILARAASQAPEVPAAAQDETEKVEAVWAYLDAHETPEVAQEARRTLESSPYLYDRLAAAALLSSFARDPETWTALTGAILEADGPVRGFAAMVLGTFAENQPEIDWRPMAADVHAILNGSNLFELTAFIRVLLQTGVGAELAAPLLRGGGHGVLMQAMVEYPEMRDPALELLRALSGMDHGTDVERWRAWVATL